MGTITVNVDDELKEKMDNHPEINWSEVTRQAIQKKVAHLELMNELVGESELTSEDVDEIADEIDESIAQRVEALKE